ncbi:AGAP000948-PA-like protein [Anopheles sinensis]|uniref:AGAP000948-PA-like protein n=1 Tax=Anopheles sinensis TaxID=74873 RepID=A0A084WF85_ANOSI|nr:AGAP000948-PA-like protein [Anopheles sinensis]
MDAPSAEKVDDGFPKSTFEGIRPHSRTEQPEPVACQLPSKLLPAATSPINGDPHVNSNKLASDVTECDEPPLLEELGIDPKQILENSLAFLNLFQPPDALIDTTAFLFKEPDLAGPISFCLTLAACLSISKSKTQFGYIYGLSTISVSVMFCFIWLMCNSLETHVTVTAVASVLGYSMLPIVALSMLNVFVTLNNFYGVLLAGAAMYLATNSSSRMFCLMTADPHQRYLIAYPCALMYALFSMLVFF